MTPSVGGITCTRHFLCTPGAAAAAPAAGRSYGEGMGTPVGAPPLPDRARPPQVVLLVGAVLVVSGAIAVAGASAGLAARVALLVPAAIAAAASLESGRRKLRSTTEVMAGCAAGLGLAAAVWGGSPATGSAAQLTVAVAVFLLLHRLSPLPAAWPLGAWVAAQLAVLRVVGALPRPLHAALFLTVALAGLGVALWGRRLVARAALIITVPWWVAGVLTGTATAWGASGLDQQLAAALLVAAAAGLLPARLRAELDPLLGPPVAVPLLAGAVAGVALSGALSALGTAGVTVAGYLGVLAATALPEFLSGWRRGLLTPVAVAGGSTMAVLALGQLCAGRSWSALSLLLVLTAVPTVLVGWHRPGERPVAIPTAIGCLTGAVLFAVPDGLLGPTAAAALLTALLAGGLLAGASLAVAVRRPTVLAAAAAAATAVVLEAAGGDLTALALLLAGQGLLVIAWAWWGTGPQGHTSAAWRIGAAELTAAAWAALATAGVHLVEAWTLPLAAGLLLAAGPALRHGHSWPAWGPGLLVAATPSAGLAVLEPGTVRPVAILLASAVAMLAGGISGLRAPLLIGAWTAVGVGVGLAATTSPWPIAAALVIGAVLLAAGARGERSPLAAFGARLADLR